jgi:phosphoribosylformimino-5-aminoimidazole carboxamide ribotide isomerase
MIVIPAIDLRDGRCVRLYQGRADRETVFAEDPVAVAERWVALGAERLHVVDLDGAFAGTPRQTALVARIVAAVAPVAVQAGGGLRDLAAVEAALATGAAAAVVGTRAALDTAFLDTVCARYPGRIVVAVDGRDGQVAVRGWTEMAGTAVLQLGRRARAAGAVALLYTDVSRDGTEQGPNVVDTAALAVGVVPLPVLASGGVASVADLERLAAIPGVAGAVVGRALYTGAVDLGAARAALARLPAPAATPPRPIQ